MFNFTFDYDEKLMEELFLQEIQKQLDKFEQRSLLMDSHQLCDYLKLSWVTIEKEFLYDPDFPSLRYGRKWLFPRDEVESYVKNQWMDRYRFGGKKKKTSKIN
ncbi:helix-turn-helix domain-containing protein [Bacillus sp. BRMEA1]|uniref:helix-turn-helix domain-containing protein n=1 Tax=Neobacillus endophyticus TaxID=2738405 RepID=UPI001563B5FB|nr:helix-turn-helix domain-containing protein [Neobacillus endophyticus]NRD80214.1 helix-turn-helix domain-containing protein [Neobacillus endophyticus]